MIEIRPSVAADFMDVCGRVNDKTVKSFTVMRDGEPIAIAGVTIEKGCFIAFSDIKKDVTDRKITIWRTANKLAEHIRELGLPAIAVTHAGRFLESIGLQCAGECEHGKIYRI